MTAFDVYIPARYRTGRRYHRNIDTVFYSSKDRVTTDEVRRSLINHDGYPSNIVVKRVPKRRR